MRYELLNEIGGFIYWIIFKFCKTKLSEEQNIKNRERNIFIFIISIFILGFISVKLKHYF